MTWSVDLALLMSMVEVSFNVTSRKYPNLLFFIMKTSNGLSVEGEFVPSIYDVLSMGCPEYLSPVSRGAKRHLSTCI